MIDQGEIVCVGTSAGPICEGTSDYATTAFQALQTAVNRAAGIYALSSAVEVNGVLDANLRTVMQQIVDAGSTFQLTDTAGNPLSPATTKLASIAARADEIATALNQDTIAVLAPPEADLSDADLPPPPPDFVVPSTPNTVIRPAGALTILGYGPWFWAGVSIIGAGVVTAIGFAMAGELKKKRPRRRAALTGASSPLLVYEPGYRTKFEAKGLMSKYRIYSDGKMVGQADSETDMVDLVNRKFGYPTKIQRRKGGLVVWV